MDILKKIAATFTDAVDAVSTANRRLALTNRLRTIEHAQEDKAKAAYEQLGRYFAEHLPEDTPDTLRELCAEARAAEDAAALAHTHIEELRGAAHTAAVQVPEENDAPNEDVSDSCAVDIAGEELPTPSIVEPVAAEAVTTFENESEEGEAPVPPVFSEEAAQDANDEIPFI